MLTTFLKGPNNVCLSGLYVHHTSFKWIKSRNNQTPNSWHLAVLIYRCKTSFIRNKLLSDGEMTKIKKMFLSNKNKTTRFVHDPTWPHGVSVVPDLQNQNCSMWWSSCYMKAFLVIITLGCWRQLYKWSCTFDVERDSLSSEENIRGWFAHSVLKNVDQWLLKIVL